MIGNMRGWLFGNNWSCQRRYEVTTTRWDEEQEQAFCGEQVMWEEFMKWKEENSRKLK